MYLTRRGYVLIGVIVVAEAAALTYGGRALNAIVAPAVVALLAGAVQVTRADRPAVERSPVKPGFPGDVRDITLDVTGERVATLDDAVPEGLTAVDTTEETSLPATLSYRVELGDRGRHTLGPLAVKVRDVLGLVGETYRTAETTTVLVYPPVYLLEGRERLLQEVLDPEAVERQEFDAIREYSPGDPLRDVHWKSTAKDPGEMYVTQFADRRIEDSVVLVATADPGHADDMAVAAASIAFIALDVNVSVELRTPTEIVPEGRGADHRDRILRALAMAEDGSVHSMPDQVDIRVDASADGVRITAGSRDHVLENLTVSRTNPLADREVTV
jgi:uncharacterized protein (DUF58 family)